MATAICKTPLCSPLKSGLFLELLLLCSRESGVLIQGSLCSPLKSGVFFGTFLCTGKGYEKRERGVLIQGLLYSPLKSGVFLALLNAPVRGM